MLKKILSISMVIAMVMAIFAVPVSAETIDPRDGYKDKTFNVEYNGKTDTITAEFLGNFNYGYTGSFLFGINALINGSTAVAGSIEKDQHDWPAIKEGYKAKTGENVI